MAGLFPKDLINKFVEKPAVSEHNQFYNIHIYICFLQNESIFYSDHESNMYSLKSCGTVPWVRTIVAHVTSFSVTQSSDLKLKCTPFCPFSVWPLALNRIF